MSFNQLLAYLEAEHERQVAALRSENQSLRQQFLQSGQRAALPLRPENDSGGTAPPARMFMEEKRGAPELVEKPKESEKPKEMVEEESQLQLRCHELKAAVTELQKATGEISDFISSQYAELELDAVAEEAPQHESETNFDTVATRTSKESQQAMRRKKEVEEFRQLSSGKDPRSRTKEFLQVLKPPPDAGFSAWFGYYWVTFANFLASEKFEMIVGGLILMNTAIMAGEIQYTGLQAGFELGHPAPAFEATMSLQEQAWLPDRPAEDSWPGGAVVFPVLEKVFTIIFCLEVLLKFMFLKCSYVTNPMNWLDIAVVLVGAVDWVLADTGKAQLSEALNPMVIRMLRLAKLARGLRMMKMTKVLDSLSLLLKCIAASMVTLFWSLCLLFVVQCIAGMIVSQMVQNWVTDETRDVEARKEVYYYYGTFTKSMLTMFEITMANWAPPARVLVKNISEWYTAYFLFYRCIVGFAVLGVITAVFIQQTMQTAAKDNDVMIRRKQKDGEDYQRKLHILFKDMDTSGDGLLSYAEFTEMLATPEMKNWMSALEIDAHDIESLFGLMAKEDEDRITFAQFADGAGRLKGQAKSIDMAIMGRQLHGLEVKIEMMMAIQQEQKTALMRKPRGLSPMRRRHNALPMSTPGGSTPGAASNYVPADRGITIESGPWSGHHAGSVYQESPERQREGMGAM